MANTELDVLKSRLDELKESMSAIRSKAASICGAIDSDALIPAVVAEELTAAISDYQQKEEEILRDKLLANRELIDKFGDISDLRNDYNHAGFRAQHTPSDTIIKNIGNDIEALNKILKDQSQDKADLQRVFINISNHPSANWEEAQLQAARQYGDVVNYPFPQVPADATADNINALAERTAQRILELYPYTDITAHIMGEMTFTFALVTQLKAHGIRCVASCTDRVAENLGNGDKLSHFHFAQFREY